MVTDSLSISLHLYFEYKWSPPPQKKEIKHTLNKVKSEFDWEIFFQIFYGYHGQIFNVNYLDPKKSYSKNLI